MRGRFARIMSASAIPVSLYCLPEGTKRMTATYGVSHDSISMTNRARRLSGLRRVSILTETTRSQGTNPK